MRKNVSPAPISIIFITDNPIYKYVFVYQLCMAMYSYVLCVTNLIAMSTVYIVYSVYIVLIHRHALQVATALRIQNPYQTGSKLW